MNVSEEAAIDLAREFLGDTAAEVVGTDLVQLPEYLRLHSSLNSGGQQDGEQVAKIKKNAARENSYDQHDGSKVYLLDQRQAIDQLIQGSQYGYLGQKTGARRRAV